MKDPAETYRKHEQMKAQTRFNSLKNHGTHATNVKPAEKSEIKETHLHKEAHDEAV